MTQPMRVESIFGVLCKHVSDQRKDEENYENEK